MDGRGKLRINIEDDQCACPMFCNLFNTSHFCIPKHICFPFLTQKSFVLIGRLGNSHFCIVAGAVVLV